MSFAIHTTRPIGAYPIVEPTQTGVKKSDATVVEPTQTGVKKSDATIVEKKDVKSAQTRTPGTMMMHDTGELSDYH
jgi:hypothetical protein